MVSLRFGQINYLAKEGLWVVVVERKLLVKSGHPDNLGEKEWHLKEGLRESK